MKKPVRRPYVISDYLIQNGFNKGSWLTNAMQYYFYKAIPNSSFYWVVKLDYGGQPKFIPKAIAGVCHVAISPTCRVFSEEIEFEYIVPGSCEKNMNLGFLTSLSEQEKWEKLVATNLMNRIKTEKIYINKSFEPLWKDTQIIVDKIWDKLEEQGDQAFEKAFVEVESASLVKTAENWIEWGGAIPSLYQDERRLAVFAVMSHFLKKSPLPSFLRPKPPAQLVYWKDKNNPVVERAIYFLIYSDSIKTQ